MRVAREPFCATAHPNATRRRGWRRAPLGRQVPASARTPASIQPAPSTITRAAAARTYARVSMPAARASRPPGAPRRSAPPANAATTAPAGSSTTSRSATVAATPAAHAAMNSHRIAPTLACPAMRRPAMTAAAALVLLGGCGGGGEQSTPTATTSTAKKDQSGVVVGRPAPQRTAPSEKAIGIGDQNPGVFSAPLFRALHITKARRVVPWDIMQLKAEQQMTDQWLAEAKRAGVEPFIT